MSMDALIRKVSEIIGYQPGQEPETYHSLSSVVDNYRFKTPGLKLQLRFNLNKVGGLILSKALAIAKQKLMVANHFSKLIQAVLTSLDEEIDSHKLNLTAELISLIPAANAEIEQDTARRIAALAHVKEMLEIAGYTGIPEANDSESMVVVYSYLEQYKKVLHDMLPKNIQAKIIKKDYTAEKLVNLIYRFKLESAVSFDLASQEGGEEVKIRCQSIQQKLADFQKQLSNIVFTDTQLRLDIQQLIEDAQQQAILLEDPQALFEVNRELSAIEARLSKCFADKFSIEIINDRGFQVLLSMETQLDNSENFIKTAHELGYHSAVVYEQLAEIKSTMEQFPRYFNTKEPLKHFLINSKVYFQKIIDIDSEIRSVIVGKLKENKETWLEKFKVDNAQNAIFYQASIENYERYQIQPPNFESNDLLENYFGEHKLEMNRIRRPFWQIYFAMNHARPDGSIEELPLVQLTLLAHQVVEFSETELAYYQGLLSPIQCENFRDMLIKLQQMLNIESSEEGLREALRNVWQSLTELTKLRSSLDFSDPGFNLFDTTDKHLLKLLVHVQYRIIDKPQAVFDRIQDKLIDARQYWWFNQDITPQQYRDNTVRVLQELTKPEYMDELATTQRNWFMRLLHFCIKCLQKITFTYSGVPNLFAASDAKKFYAEVCSAREAAASVLAP